MISDNTIFAPSTPLGGAIVMIRISGAETKNLLRKFFIPQNAGAFPEHRRMTYVRLVDNEGELVDECSAVFYRAPNSYTGEDMAEVFLHGSPAAANRLFNLLQAEKGVRPAEPGEFTKRAFLNGKTDLSGAEAVMDMISASTELSRKAAAFQLAGGLKKRIDALYDELCETAAYIAAVTDYPDEMEDEALSGGELEARISCTACAVRSLIENGLASKVLRDGARVAISGEPNAGKSSLLNALLGRERAIVTELAGTTRDTIEEPSEMLGVPVVFIDTAGLNETEDRVESLGVARAMAALDTSELILWLRQGNKPLAEAEKELYSRVKVKKHIVLFTKCDAWAEPDADALAFYNGAEIIPVSSLTGAGLEELKHRAAGLLHPTEAPAIVTNSRHINALESAYSSLESAKGCLKNGMGLDCCATDIAEAMHAMGGITGKDADADVIDAVFSRFCVGK